MKLILPVLAIFLAANCQNNSEKPAEPVATPEPAVEQAIPEEDTLVGNIAEQDLRQAPFASWYEPTYEEFNPSPEALEVIKENIHEYSIKLYMGTWCSDSQRDVPKFMKLLELSDYNMANFEMIAVEGDKTLPDDSQKEYDIEYVPTIIFLKDGKEVNRYVEYAQESLEADIAAIVSGAEYENSYADW